MAMRESLEPRAADPPAGLGGHSIAHEHALFAALAILFAALVAALVLWFRRAARASEIEELDRLIGED
jgi:Flp pilus assembly protein TadB